MDYPNTNVFLVCRTRLLSDKMLFTVSDFVGLIYFFFWIHILFHSVLIIASLVILVYTWQDKHESAPHLRFYICIMTVTSIARIYQSIYERRFPLVITTDTGTEILRPINTFWGKLSLFIHRYVDKICLFSSMFLVIILDKESSKFAEESIPELFWMAMTYALIYFMYFVAPLFFDPQSHSVSSLYSSRFATIFNLNILNRAGIKGPHLPPKKFSRKFGMLNTLQMNPSNTLIRINRNKPC